MILDARGDILIEIWFKRLPECKRRKGNKRGPLQFQSANWHTVSLAISYHQFLFMICRYFVAEI